jgi:hypothetical protein
MSEERRLNLLDSMHLADSLLATPAMSLMLAREPDDPLRLNLPPLVGGGANSLVPDATTLKMMAALYFQAELEQAGVIVVAELLADARYQLTIQDVQAANLLEEFFRRKRDWLDRDSREHVFARVFGLGSLARNEEGALINRDFQSKFANFCLNVWRCAEELKWQKTPNPMLDAAVRQAAVDVLINLGGRRYGDLYGASRRIQDQLSRAIALLNYEGIGSAFQVRGMWNVLQTVLSPNVPDFARITTRGQSGLNLLNWLVSVLPLVTDRNSRQPLISPALPVGGYAEMWLTATGFDLQRMNLRRAA